MKAKYWLLTFLTFILLLPSCIKEQGFTEGAFIKLVNGNEERITLLYTNSNGLGDSILCEQDIIKHIAVDMNSDKMRLLVKGKNSRSVLDLNYKIKIWNGPINFKLHMDSITAQLDNTLNQHHFFEGETRDGINGFLQWRDPLFPTSYWDFINEANSVLWVEQK